MTPRFLFLCLCLASTGAAMAADDATAVVRLANNDRIAGSLASLTPDQLVLKSPDQEKPTPVPLKNALDLTLPAALPETVAESEATLTLTNGDTVRGQLAAVTDQTIALDTWFAGRVTFNRLMVASVKIAEKTAWVYRGPTGLDGWYLTEIKSPVSAKNKPRDEGKPAWSYSGLAFRSTGAGSIARDEVLPDECIIRFDVAWTGRMFGLKVLTFTEDPAAEALTSGYAVVFQYGGVFLKNLKNENFFGYMNALTLPDTGRAHIEIRESVKSGRMGLWINDDLIGTWTDPDVSNSKFGRTLQFVSSAESPVQISGIGIASWDGVVDPMSQIVPRPARWMGQKPQPVTPRKLPDGHLELANGDIVEGEAVAVSDGVVAVKTPLGIVKLPVGRFRTVALKKADLERCKRMKGDIRAWFTDGSSMVFRLDAAEEDALTGYSQNFGTATFKLAAFNFIEFNIHDPSLEDQRAPRE